MDLPPLAIPTASSVATPKATPEVNAQIAVESLLLYITAGLSVAITLLAIVNLSFHIHACRKGRPPRIPKSTVSGSSKGGAKGGGSSRSVRG
ncbi:Uu.00g131670.m01.CDS01 [Anthostomella pinea]|uniref:Uu.00g131670.m01.CDS01 n=1 Tax=Anthostomella pinea TaxID=933095 RepID=A0AAI8YFV9_9PEZI|nr:Uu.00g131670.m01.CDS01 [Anthostomella pinea]